MRIIFTAGADRTGKSTLTSEFIKYGWTYMHFGPPKKSPYSEYREYLDNVLKNHENAGKNFIIDRYMYCEFAYSKHYGRKTDMTIERMHKIEKEILKLDRMAAIIYCETDLTSNWERIRMEGKNEFRNIGELFELKEEYERVLGLSKLAVVRYDFTKGDTPADFFKKINYIH